jgi:hypothetical protein
MVLLLLRWEIVSANKMPEKVESFSAEVIAPDSFGVVRLLKEPFR